MDHQRERCHKEHCKHWHIRHDYVQPIYRALIGVSVCCYTHGDPSSRHPSFQIILERSLIEMVFEPDDPPGPRIFVTPDVFARTRYWDLLIPFSINHPLSVRRKRVCRLHHHQRCNRAYQCGNAHMCHHVLTVCTALRSLNGGEGLSAFLVKPNPEGSPIVTSGDAGYFQSLLSLPQHLSLTESLSRLRQHIPVTDVL